MMWNVGVIKTVIVIAALFTIVIIMFFPRGTIQLGPESPILNDERLFAKGSIK